MRAGMLRQTVRSVKPQLDEEHPAARAAEGRAEMRPGAAESSLENNLPRDNCREKSGKHGTPGNGKQARARNLSRCGLRTAHEPVNHRNASAWFD